MNANARHLELIARYADGQATDDELRELESALQADPSLRLAMVRYLNIDSALTAGTVSAEPPLPLAPVMQRRRFAAAWWLLPLATAAAVVVSLWQPWTTSPQPQTTRLPATQPASPAVLAASTHARWADANVELALRSGDLPNTPLRLESGSAEFRFTHGATALILGPATVRFAGVNQLFLQDGKLLCKCPTPDSRLTVITPATRVVDQGTEFAVDVAADRPDTRVAVLRGEVHVGTRRVEVLRTGQAAEVGPDQVVRLTPLPPDALADLVAADLARTPDGLAADASLLLDPEFTAGLNGPWRCTESHVDIAGTPIGQAMRIHANGHRFWPSVRQAVSTGDIAGRLVIASVVARTPGGDPLTDRQAGILKVVFMDAQGREFATASRHFLHAGSSAMVIDQPVTSQVAAFAPPGTQKVEVQLLLSARGKPTGLIEYANPRLYVMPTGP
jgi:ferric-dicitrate binding protein FerR (iron transport regulator)